MLKHSKQDNQSGFTLLESILAIGILSVVVVQILGVQTSSVMVTQTARETMRATWAMRQTVAQIEYVLDAFGAKGLPAEAKYDWPADPGFVTSFVSTQTSIAASKFFTTAMRLGAQTNGDAEKNTFASEDPASGFKGIGDLIDQQVPKDIYYSLAIVVNWKQGDTARSLDSGLLIVDDKVAFSGAGGLSSLLGAVPGGNNATGNNPAGTNPTGNNPTGNGLQGNSPNANVRPPPLGQPGQGPSGISSGGGVDTGASLGSP